MTFVTGFGNTLEDFLVLLSLLLAKRLGRPVPNHPMPSIHRKIIFGFSEDEGVEEMNLFQVEEPVMPGLVD